MIHFLWYEHLSSILWISLMWQYRKTRAWSLHCLVLGENVNIYKEGKIQHRCIFQRATEWGCISSALHYCQAGYVFEYPWNCEGAPFWLCHQHGDNPSSHDNSSAKNPPHPMRMVIGINVCYNVSSDVISAQQRHWKGRESRSKEARWIKDLGISGFPDVFVLPSPISPSQYGLWAL